MKVGTCFRNGLFAIGIGAILLLINPCYSNAVSGDVVKGVRSESFSVQQTIERLQKKILDLEEGNSMLMENLGNCMDENEELFDKLKAIEKDKSLTKVKQGLIRSLKESLRTSSNLDFLRKLGVKDLQVLLDAVRHGDK